MATNFDAHSLDEAISSGKLVLVDFWAEWCGPCRMLSPIIDKLTADYAEKPIVIGKVNTEEEPDITEIYAVQSLPRLLLLKGGEIVWDYTGACHEKKIKDAIDPHLC